MESWRSQPSIAIRPSMGHASERRKGAFQKPATELNGSESVTQCAEVEYLSRGVGLPLFLPRGSPLQQHSADIQPACTRKRTRHMPARTAPDPCHAAPVAALATRHPGGVSSVSRAASSVPQTGISEAAARDEGDRHRNTRTSARKRRIAPRVFPTLQLSGLKARRHPGARLAGRAAVQGAKRLPGRIGAL